MKKRTFDWDSQLPAIAGTVMACLWLGLFPLWNGGTYSHITLDKWLGMNWITGICGAITTAALIFLAVRKKLPGSVRFGLPHLLLALYLVWMALAARLGAWHDQLNSKGQLVTLYGAIRHEGLWTLLKYGAIFVCLSLFPVRPKPLLWVAGATLLLTAGLAGIQYFNTNPFGLFPKGHNILINYEFQSTLGNIDILNGYLALTVPLLLGGWLLYSRSGFFLTAALAGVEWMLCIDVQSGLIVLLGCAGVVALAALRSGKYRAKALGALSGICLMIALRQMIRLPWLDGVDALGFAVSGRALLLLIPAALLLGGALLTSRKPGKDLTWRILLPIVAVLLVAALLAFLWMEIPESMGGLWEIHEILCGRPQESFGSYRIAVWGHTLHLAKEHPVFGIGPDTYYYAMQEHLRQEGAALPEAFDNPHNMVLSVLISGGIPAVLCWLALIALLLWLGIRKGGWTRVSALACAAYLLQGMFVFSICLVTPMFWAVAGITCHLILSRQKEAS